MIGICVLAFATALSVTPDSYKCWWDAIPDSVIYAIDRCDELISNDKCTYLVTPSSNVHYFLFRPKR